MNSIVKNDVWMTFSLVTIAYTTMFLSCYFLLGDIRYKDNLFWMEVTSLVLFSALGIAIRDECFN